MAIFYVNKERGASLRSCQTPLSSIKRGAAVTTIVTNALAVATGKRLPVLPLSLSA
jgi:hypothetical protein